MLIAKLYNTEHFKSKGFDTFGRMAEPTEEVPTQQESDKPEPVVASETNAQPTEAAKAKKKKKKNKKKKAANQAPQSTEVEIKVLDGLKPVEVDQKAIEVTNNEFKKGGLNQYKFWQGQPVPQFCAFHPFYFLFL